MRRRPAVPPRTQMKLLDRGVRRTIEVTAGIYGEHGSPDVYGPHLTARWQHWVGHGTSAVGAGAAGVAAIPDCELELGIDGDDLEQWDKGCNNRESIAALMTRDARVIRAYGQLLLQLADLVELEP